MIPAETRLLGNSIPFTSTRVPQSLQFLQLVLS
uniref:Rpd3 n=1 Tax=Arundo donax TaxID=35708 RepID=A0A0A9CUF5_ARUDO